MEKVVGRATYYKNVNTIIIDFCEKNEETIESTRKILDDQLYFSRKTPTGLDIYLYPHDFSIFEDLIKNLCFECFVIENAVLFSKEQLKFIADGLNSILRND